MGDIGHKMPCPDKNCHLPAWRRTRLTPQLNPWIARQTVLLFALCWLLYGCSSPPDDASQIHANLDAMAIAAGRKDSRALMDYLSVDFLANEAMRKPEMFGMVYAYFQQNPIITVTLMDTAITVQEDTAQSHFKLVLTGGAQPVPERLRWLEVELQWVRLDAQWKIHRAKWRDVGSQLRE